ncbi:MAG: hypothetical protein MZW92_65815 [Comamonadaceae bacterium]|nr:hypothetical protein [Comamonadaceae bacterium]
MQSMNEELQTINARTADQARRPRAGAERHAEPAQQHRHRHAVPGQRPQRAALHRADHARSSTCARATSAAP